MADLSTNTDYSSVVRWRDWFGTDATAFSARLEEGRNAQAYRERWKYTKPAKVAELLHHQTQPAKLESDGTSIDLVEMSRSERARFRQPTPEVHPEACEALVLSGDALYAQLSGTDATYTLTHDAASTPLFLEIAPQARVRLIEQTGQRESAYQCLWLHLQPGSRLVHTVGNFAGQRQWRFVHVVVEGDAEYTLFNHTSGSALQRHDHFIECAAPGANVDLEFASVCRSGNELDQHTTLTHAAPDCRSRQRVHNIVMDGGKASFNGRIHILKNCPRVDASLNNRNLALGTTATINTKPELEIYTDEVKCAHGATIGQLSEDQLFYFFSRGIAPDEARRALAKAFLNECNYGPLAEETRAQFEALI